MFQLLVVLFTKNNTVFRKTMENLTKHRDIKEQQIREEII